MSGTCNEIINTCKTVVGEDEGKRPLWAHKRRLKGNIKMDLKDAGRENVIDLSGSGWNPVAVSCEHDTTVKLRVP
jgi:hypothetical protein